MGGGIALGFALGWGTKEAFVIAGAVGISSSAIATKLLVELRRLANRETKMILGILVVEDVFLALYLALLSPILGGAESSAEAVFQVVRAFVFLAVLFAIARYGSKIVGRVIDTEDDETLTVTFVGLAVLVAGIAHEMGVSDAIGAFMVGMILSETAARERIERLVLPLRDAFAAVFFFTFGLTIDPSDIGGAAGPVSMRVLVDPSHACSRGRAGRAYRAVRGAVRACAGDRRAVAGVTFGRARAVADEEPPLGTELRAWVRPVVELRRDAPRGSAR
jgi:monovalent cation:H+ antiporter-2, CPA2 family